ncbi:MAG: fatty acid desaturase [bacterium]
MSDAAFVSNTKIDWYRSPIDKALLAQLMQRSALRGWVQTGLHLGLFFTTGTLAYLCFNNISAANWHWNLPLLFVVLFIHGTIGPFMGFIAIHELQHRTVFKNRLLNEVFEAIYAFISWSDYIWYQQSHAIHHRVTCYEHQDGEVVLPQRFSLRRWNVWLGLLAYNPKVTWQKLKILWGHANGVLIGEWYNHVLPKTDKKLRARHRRWAIVLLGGHLLLAMIFVATGYWFLIVVFTIGTQYCGWLGFLCGLPQHYGLKPNEADYRLNARTFTCSKLVGFYYWNMQYHLEHHMYPAVPFHQLPKLRAQIAGDLPAAPHGLIATWREMLAIRAEMMRDPEYQYVPSIPEPKKFPAETAGAPV